MKKGFTLIEMLVVVAVIGTLMGIVFRLTSVAGEESRKITTVTRLQKLENCLSGYYAAFGSYPPVKLYGSRDIFRKIDGNSGMQGEGRNDQLVWRQIHAALESQPVACNFPFADDMENQVLAYSDELRERCSGNEFKKYADSSTNPRYKEMSSGIQPVKYADFQGGDLKESKFEKVQLFRFGLMSYLLPRYLFMMGCDPRFFGDGGTASAQWIDNNDDPYDACEGYQIGWDQVIRYVQPGRSRAERNLANYLRVANMPTQSVCGRWVANLEGSCRCSRSLEIFGVDIKDPDYGMFWLSGDEDSSPPNPPVYSPGGRGAKYYILDTVSIVDGWGNTFYYYSPDGYQSYTLWSAGPNGLTFPPWVAREEVDPSRQVEGTYYKPEKRPYRVSEMIEDDIIRMNH